MTKETYVYQICMACPRELTPDPVIHKQGLMHIHLHRYRKRDPVFGGTEFQEAGVQLWSWNLFTKIPDIIRRFGIVIFTKS